MEPKATGGARRAAASRRSPSRSPRVAPANEARSSSGIGELDRVLGGGVVPGSVVLIGGDPGIGKSTLVLQALAQLATRGPALYVSGEESPQQIKMRADRLGVAEPQLLVLAETSVEALLDHAQRVATGGAGRRLDPDRVHRAARPRRPAASARCARAPRRSCSSPSARDWPAFSSAT